MANPLTLLMPVIPGTEPAAIAAALAEYGPQLDAALNSIGTVHYARTLYLDTSSANLQPGASSTGPFVLGIITEYDGSFNAYIGDFVKQVSAPFNALMKFVVGGDKVIPVENNTAAFAQFIAANDASQHAPNTGLFEAYPYSVQDIKAAGIPTPSTS
jgi:hypothetical protein